MGERVFRSDKFPEGGHDFLGLRRKGPFVTSRVLKHRLDLVAGQEGKADQLSGHGGLAVAHQIEHRFYLVAESGDVVKTEHGTRTLEGVHGAENPVDQLLIHRVLLQFEKG